MGDSSHMWRQALDMSYVEAGIGYVLCKDVRKHLKPYVGLDILDSLLAYRFTVSNDCRADFGEFLEILTTQTTIRFTM